MKTEQENSNKPTESGTKENYESQATDIFCINQVLAHQVCTNQQCTKYPFLCIDDQCKCHSQHPKCLKSTKKSLMIALEDKLVSYRPIEQKIKKYIQAAIDELSDFETQLLKQCQNKFKQFVGLTEFQKQFMKGIKLGQVQNINGKTIWTIQLNLKKSEKITKMMEKLDEDINGFCKKFQENLKLFHLDVKDRLQFFGSGLFQDSKILTTNSQSKMVQQFFSTQGQKIKTVKLLFRGSQNGFLAANFHKMCDTHTQTITFCEDTYGKTIGGYTPFGWNSGNAYNVDSTGKSFTFSLSNNHKFVQQSIAQSVYCHSSYGPTFGGHDMYISDKCHQNFSSYCNINVNYINANYTASNQVSYTSMTGGQQNYNFKVKEYEVWKVQLMA